jgi:hypothetical protein
MKNILKLFGIIAIVAVILFGMAACDNGSTPTHTHQWGNWTQTTAPTCTTEGEETRVCELDATHKETRPGNAALGHDWGDWTVNKAATETVDGEEIRICKHDESHKETRTVAAHEHDWSKWEEITPPACEEDGVETRTCSVGGETETCPIAALGHAYGNWTQTTAPTCITAGMETGTCSHDSTHTTTRTVAIDPDAHDWGSWETTATFISAGISTRTCRYESSHIETKNVDPLPITTTAEWDTALSQLNGKTGNYTLTISGNIGVAGIPSYTNSFGTTESGSALTVTMKGNGKLYLTSKGNIFFISANQTLIIDNENLTLEGLTNGKNGATENNDANLIHINNGTLELKNGLITGNTTSGGATGVMVSGNATFTMDGGKISGNSSDNWSCYGGVNVQGTFTMNGGEISGNTAGGGNIDNKGGGSGVHVQLAATFTMNGGKIFGNTTSGEYSYGGGVFIGGTFTMNGGEIFNNSSGNGGGGVYVGYRSSYFFGTFHFVNGTIFGVDNSELSNTAPNGAALFVEDGSIAQRGTFTGEIWTSSGSDLTTTNDTID